MDNYITSGYFNSKETSVPIAHTDQIDTPVSAILHPPLPPTNLYFLSIMRIRDVKTGPFHEHSSQLHSIATGVQLWSKVNSGLFKMYEVRTLPVYFLLADAYRFPGGSPRQKSRCATPTVRRASGVGFSRRNGADRLFLGTDKFTSTYAGTVVAHNFCASGNSIPCSTALDVCPTSSTASAYRTPQQKRVYVPATHCALRYDHSSAGTVGSAC